MMTEATCTSEHRKNSFSVPHVVRPSARTSKIRISVARNLIEELLDALARKARLAFVLVKLPVLKVAALELFDSVSVEIDVDPEIDDCQYVVVCVTAHGAIEEIAQRQREWHRNTSGIHGNHCDLVRLSVDVSE